jgi:hypothetical protein
VKYQNKSFSVSGAGDSAYEEGYERVFGDRKPVVRGRWIWDERTQKLVRAEDYVPPSEALSAPIMTDRFYEGVRTVDGVDIGSRRKRRDYMKARGLADGDDFSPGYYERVRREKQAEERRDRKQDLIDTVRSYYR